ncbi:protein-disulfide reductase DsbD N-terminal domain-containing protein [Flavobacteriaceae bacterium F08102]|nr:protein-disulfide reductase DsbD N-terminal domain-containing protein [Flavobacteriaceae bacterium F08102]
MNNMYSFLVCFLVFVSSGWAQSIEVSPELKQKIEKAGANLHLDKTHAMDPVAVNATLVWSDDKSQVAVVMKASVEIGWHIYAYVPETAPYITTELKLELPKGVTAIGEWKTPKSKPYDEGIYVYEDEVVFVQYCTVDAFANEAKITSGMYYQTCDIHKCFPPVTKSIDLPLK